MDKTNLFTDHPIENGMTYSQHMRFALMLSRETFGCALASLVHSVFPFLFVTHTSRTVAKLNEIFVKRQTRTTEQHHQPSTNNKRIVYTSNNPQNA